MRNNYLYLLPVNSASCGHLMVSTIWFLCFLLNSFGTPTHCSAFFKFQHIGAFCSSLSSVLWSYMICYWLINICSLLYFHLLQLGIMCLLKDYARVLLNWCIGVHNIINNTIRVFLWRPGSLVVSCTSFCPYIYIYTVRRRTLINRNL